MMSTNLEFPKDLALYVTDEECIFKQSKTSEVSYTGDEIITIYVNGQKEEINVGDSICLETGKITRNNLKHNMD